MQTCYEQSKRAVQAPQTRHQSLVAVSAGIGKRIDSPGMFENSANVIQRFIAEPAVAVTGKDVFTRFEDRLVDVHP